MKKIITIIYVLFSSNLLFAQEPVLKWAKQFGGTQSEYGTSIVADAAGNVYTTGYFQDTVDFDPGAGIFNLIATGPIPSAFHINAFISKLDATGNFVWAKKIGGNYCLSNAITLDKSSGIIITGSFQGTVDFDPGAAMFNLTAAQEDIYICKLDVNGNFLWAKQTVGNSIFPNLATSLTIDNADNIFCAGIFSGIRDFDPSGAMYNLVSSSSAGYILKLNSSGNFVWAKKIGEGVEEIQMVSDIIGNIYSSGKFNQIADFDPGTNVFNLSPSGSNNTFISKLDLNGNFLWVKQILAPRIGLKFEIDVDQFGNVYVPGSFQGTIDFDPGAGVFNLTALGNSDLYILKLNASGNFIWAKQIGGLAAVNTAGGIAVDLYENVYTSGQFSRATDFDPGAGVNLLTSLGQSDIFLLKLNSSGDFIWAKSMGAVNDYNGSTSLFVDTFRNIYTTGYFLGATDFDPGLGVLNFNAIGDYDAFVQKLSECVNKTSAVISATACNTYTLNAKTYTKTGTYYQSLQNVAGCDSLITLHLTINGGTKIFNENICNSYLWNNRIYAVSGTYKDTLIGSTGCDSILILNLTVNKKSFSTLNKTICQGQNFEGYALSGIFTDTLFNINGCDSIRTLFLTVKASCIPVSIPNAFTPNKDGTNDIFKPIITQEVSAYSFTIFNRYGQKIFASNNYGLGWDGTFKGLAQPRNAYIYLLKFKNNNGELLEYKGIVTLIR